VEPWVSFLPCLQIEDLGGSKLKEKHSSLLRNGINYGRKMLALYVSLKLFPTKAPGEKARVFVPDKFFSAQSKAKCHFRPFKY
jgi:hypothetical protein